MSLQRGRRHRGQVFHQVEVLRGKVDNLERKLLVNFRRDSQSQNSESTCLMGLDPFAVEVMEPLELHDQDRRQPPDLKLESCLLQ